MPQAVQNLDTTLTFGVSKDDADKSVKTGCTSKRKVDDKAPPKAEACNALAWCTYLFSCMATSQEYSKKIDEKKVPFSEDLKIALTGSFDEMKGLRATLENLHMAGGKDTAIKETMEAGMHSLSNTTNNNV